MAECRKNNDCIIFHKIITTENRHIFMEKFGSEIMFIISRFTMPYHKTAKFQLSFRYNIYRLFDRIPIELD